jgi:hypothetical protein
MRATEVQNHTSSLFEPALLHQQVFAGDGVRTLRRGFADILFADSSEIRLNERSDLVVEDSYTMRRYALAEGAIWVRVARGVRTVVRTPVGTATARGTVFTIDAHGTLTVLEGTVDFEVDGATAQVHAGQTATFSPESGTFNLMQSPYTIIDPESGLTSNGWFDHPGEDGYEALDLSAVDQGSRQYILEGDQTPKGGVASPVDILTGVGVLAGAGAMLGSNGPARNNEPVPEPGVVPAMAVGFGGLGLASGLKRFRRPKG